MVPNEVLLMLIAAGGPESKGKSAAITLMDWCDLDEQIVLVMERPVNCRNLINYMDHCPLQEALLKVSRQNVSVAKILLPHFRNTPTCVSIRTS